MKYENLGLISQLVKGRQADDWDAFLVITGQERGGKTTLSLQIMLRILKDFDLERNIAYKNKEIRDKLKNLKEGDGLIIDEAIRAMYKRDWMKNLNKQLIRLFAQIGFKKYCVVMNIPNFQDIDKNIRNHRVFLWIHVYARGKAVIFKKSGSAFDTEDPWDIKQSMKTIRKYYKSSLDDEEQLVKGYKKLFTYVGHLRFPDLPDKLKEEYKEISEKRKLEEDDEEEIDKWRRRTLIMAYNLHTMHDWTSKEISELVNKEVGRTGIHRWYDLYSNLPKPND